MNFKHCDQCPRVCGINRNIQTGFCGEMADIRIAWAGLHFGEEPPITAIGGSGAIFLSGCNLRCCFCQNAQISQQGMGRKVRIEDFVEICLLLQDFGAENINIVTGSHAPLALSNGIKLAKESGLKIPVCWNSSSYESIEAINMLANVVDIWLPDLKTLDPKLASDAFSTPDYPKIAMQAVHEMAKNSKIEFETLKNENGDTIQKMSSGMIVRHLALPGHLDDTKRILDWICTNLKDKALLSLMTQYTPIKNAKKTPFENRFLSEKEYISLNELLNCYDQDGFMQELEQDDQWLPDFDKIHPFSSNLAKTVWHWKIGYATT